jgi:hypothetical protein
MPRSLVVVVIAVAACGSNAPRAGDDLPATAATAATVQWPPIVDSHVHLAYFPVASELATHGVLAAVDLAAPERTLSGPRGQPALTVIAAGPMLTHPGGYPLDAWGADGYGVGCADAACVQTTIDRLAGEGAGVIKLALDEDGLDPALVPAAVAAAHAHHLRVAAHALTNASAAGAALAGVDILAHTPVEPLTDASAAGLDDAAIADAMTTTPIAYWGLHFDPNTTYLEVAGDPRRDVRVLLHPRRVVRN